MSVCLVIKWCDFQRKLDSKQMKLWWKYTLLYFFLHKYMMVKFKKKSNTKDKEIDIHDHFHVQKIYLTTILGQLSLTLLWKIIHVPQVPLLVLKMSFPACPKYGKYLNLSWWLLRKKYSFSLWIWEQKCHYLRYLKTS